ncbi:hypothetical protein [Streptomyces sp. NPDC057623]|uniref:hypothetical protein n=1 Tax=Streptomyces sp. NPDC057623 TaxID=3346187 RepID=UPI0036B067B5
MKHPADQARDLALGVLESVTSAAIPEVSDLADAVPRFGEVKFDVPTEGETDRFLFGYSYANWLSEPRFALGFTRQLALVGHGFYPAILGIRESAASLCNEFGISCDLAGALVFASHQGYIYHYIDTHQEGAVYGLTEDSPTPIRVADAFGEFFYDYVRTA